MADTKSGDKDLELDDQGQPIKTDDAESGGKPLKKDTTTDNDDDAGDDKGTGKAPTDDEPEIPVRKSALQHIISRKNRQIDKLKSRDEEDDDEEPVRPVSKRNKDDDDDDSLTPEARTAVERHIARSLDPVVKAIASRADEDELRELISSEPEAAKYEKSIRRYMEHPNYKGVAPSVIFHHLAFDAAAKTGDRKKKAADLEANQSRGGGRSTRSTGSNTNGIPTPEELDAMTPEEFRLLQSRARQGEFVKRDEN